MFKDVWVPFLKNANRSEKSFQFIFRHANVWIIVFFHFVTDRDGLPRSQVWNPKLTLLAESWRRIGNAEHQNLSGIPKDANEGEDASAVERVRLVSKYLNDWTHSKVSLSILFFFQDVEEMCSSEWPDWERVMYYVALIFRHFEGSTSTEDISPILPIPQATSSPISPTFSTASSSSLCVSLRSSNSIPTKLCSPLQTV